MRAWGISFVFAFLKLVPCACAQDSAKPLARIAFGSCANQNRKQPIWNAIREFKPDLFLFIGDNVYADASTPDDLRAAYEKLSKIPEFKQFWAETEISATWDDHDYGGSDIGAEYRLREESRKIFLDFFKVPRSSPRWTQPGIYTSFIRGGPGQRVQIILLDTRFNRGPLKPAASRCLPSRTNPLCRRYDPDFLHAQPVLGEEQWKWLNAELARAADFRIIVTSTPALAVDNKFESWWNFPFERARLLELLKSLPAKRFVLLSGDRHFAELTKFDDGSGFSVIEATSSGLTEQAPGEWDNSLRLGQAYYGHNFGALEISWKEGKPSVKVSLRNEIGAVVRETSIN